MMMKTLKPLTTAALVVLMLLTSSWHGSSTAVSLTSPQKQPATVRAQTTADGFTGTCDTGSQTAGFEGLNLTDGSAISRIRQSDGRAVVEVLRKDNLVEIKFPNAKLTMDLGTKTLVGYSEKDKEDFRQFFESPDAALVRDCIGGLTKALEANKDLLKRNDGKTVVPIGLMMVGILLGDDPASRKSKPQVKNHHARAIRVVSPQIPTQKRALSVFAIRFAMISEEKSVTDVVVQDVLAVPTTLTSASRMIIV